MHDTQLIGELENKVLSCVSVEVNQMDSLNAYWYCERRNRVARKQVRIAGSSLLRVDRRHKGDHEQHDEASCTDRVERNSHGRDISNVTAVLCTRTRSDF